LLHTHLLITRWDTAVVSSAPTRRPLERSLSPFTLNGPFVYDAYGTPIGQREPLDFGCGAARPVTTLHPSPIRTLCAVRVRPVPRSAMTIPPSDLAKGRALEERLRDVLRFHGYDVATNVRITGRSGAWHEFDVVGDKADGLTRYRLVVECKAWAHPIDKDVVYTLFGKLSDVGAAQGVIVAPGGWTAQAAAVAVQHHIDLWGTDELNARLPLFGEGAVPLEQTPVIATGVPFSTAVASGRQEVERAARGRLGLGRDVVAWFGAAWLPVWTLQLGLRACANR